MLYFDHNATTPVRPRVLEVVARVQGEVFGNPSSQHAPGRRARALLEESRERIAAVLDVSARELVFTAGGTEGNRLALELSLPLDAERPHLVASGVEHASILEPCRRLDVAGEADFEEIATASTGIVSLEDLEARLRPNTCLVALQHANNETGMLQPVAAAAVLCARWRAGEGGTGLLLCDATQTLGKVPVRPQELGVDFLTLSSHKIGGPKGAGVLWVRGGAGRGGVGRGRRGGGGPQEHGVRPGTENLPAVAGFAEALELADAEAMQGPRFDCGERLASGLAERLGGVRVQGGPGPRLHNTVNLSFDGVPAELLIIRLDAEGVAVSTGAACASGSREPSHVLEAMGVSAERTRGAVRFSAGWSTTPEEIERLLGVVQGVIVELRGRLAETPE